MKQMNNAREHLRATKTNTDRKKNNENRFRSTRGRGGNKIKHAIKHASTGAGALDATIRCTCGLDRGSPCAEKVSEHSF